jgi:hypothetical protein
MAKLKLPKDVAIALERVINERGKAWAWNMPSLHNAAKKDKNLKKLLDYMGDDKERYETLQEATYNGFEYDATPEEKLLDFYNANNGTFIADTIVRTLDILGKKVKGINC